MSEETRLNVTVDVLKCIIGLIYSAQTTITIRATIRITTVSVLQT